MPLRQDLVGDDQVLDTQMAGGEVHDGWYTCELSKSVTRSEIERDRQRSRLSQR